MATEEQHDRADASSADDATAQPPQRGFGAEMNAPHAVAGEDDVHADNDASARAGGAAGEQGGSGISGLGGSSGGSGNYGGVGLPGGARTLGTGRLPSGDSRQSGTTNAGGLGTPANAALGSDAMRSAEIPPGTYGGASDAFQQSHGGGEAATQHASAHDHGGHLSLAGGSAGSGGGGADLLNDSASATDTSGA